MGYEAQVWRNHRSKTQSIKEPKIVGTNGKLSARVCSPSFFTPLELPRVPSPRFQTHFI